MRNCVLIAGMPASGKTTFARRLGEDLALPVISKDCIKEKLYDTVGFANREEKVALSVASTQILYYFADSMMRAGQSFILENNFENVAKPQLEQLLGQYQYRTLTVRFVGDVRAIYQRFLQREQNPQRHPGHKTNLAWPPSQGDDQVLQAPLTFEEFITGVESRGIRDFSVGGEEIQVDTTHIDQLRTAEVIRQVRLVLGGRFTP